MAFRNRIYTCANGMGIEVPQTFAYLTLSLDMGEQAIRDRVYLEIQRLHEDLGMPVQLVVVDTFWRAFPGINENSAEDMSKAIKAITDVAYRHDAGWLAVHHEGKSTGSARGSSALLGAVDTELKVEQNEATVGAVSCLMKCTKSRDGIAGQEWEFQLKGVTLGQDEDGDDVTSAFVEFSNASEKRGKRKITDRGRSILEAIRQMTSDPGADKNPGGLGFPDRGKHTVIRKSELIDHAMGQMADDDRKTARKKVTSGMQTLIDNGWIKVNNDFLWILP